VEERLRTDCLCGTRPCCRSRDGASARSTRLEPFICSPENRGECLSLGGRQSAVGPEVQFDRFNSRQLRSGNPAVRRRLRESEEIETDTKPVSDTQEAFAATKHGTTVA
jgi:hypothetical protein